MVELHGQSMVTGPVQVLHMCMQMFIVSLGYQHQIVFWLDVTEVYLRHRTVEHPTLTSQVTLKFRNNIV